MVIMLIYMSDGRKAAHDCAPPAPQLSPRGGVAGATNA